MKKRIISLTLLVISFALVLLLASCGKGNERTEVVFIEKNDRYESCEHNWQIKGQTLATCVSEGKIAMSCTLCRKVNTVSTPKVECKYNTYWKWYNNQTLPRLYFECPLNTAHTYSVDGACTTTTVEKTCIQRGSVTKVAEATHNGEKYTDTLVIDKGLGSHSYGTEYELIGFNCDDGLKKIMTCAVCGDVEETTVYSHLLLNEETVYSFEELGLCAGGSITCRVCLCGEKHSDEYTAHYPSCTITRSEDVVHDGAIDYYSFASVCSDCGFNYMFDGAAADSADGRYMYAYKIYTYALTEEITLINENFDESAHDLLGHEVEYSYEQIADDSLEDRHIETATCTECPYHLTSKTFHNEKYTYEPLGATCKDGFFATTECGCGYQREFVSYNHKTKSIEATYDLESYGFCQGEIRIEVCYCGEKSIKIYNSVWVSYRKKETVEKTDTNKYYKTVERCSACGFELVTVVEHTLIEGIWFKTGETTSVYLDEQTTLSTRQECYELISIDGSLVTEESKKLLEEYFEALKNQSKQ